MILIVQWTPLASIRNVKTHALKEIHVLSMLNVESPIIDRSAIVHQAGAEILKECVINVS